MESSGQQPRAQRPEDGARRPGWRAASRRRCGASGSGTIRAGDVRLRGKCSAPGAGARAGPAAASGSGSAAASRSGPTAASRSGPAAIAAGAAATPTQPQQPQPRPRMHPRPAPTQPGPAYAPRPAPTPAVNPAQTYAPRPAMPTPMPPATAPMTRPPQPPPQQPPAGPPRMPGAPGAPGGQGPGAPGGQPPLTPGMQPRPEVRGGLMVEDRPVADFDLHRVLGYLLQQGGSDLHLSVGSPPLIRLRGDLEPIPDQEQLTPQVVQRVLYAILTQKQRERFEEELELDFAYAMPGASRFRVNVYRQRESLGAAFRVIPYEIKTLEQLGINPRVATAWPTCRAAWCWSPGRPAPASRPHWPRWWIWPTAPARTTS